jgi:hypothetical protein
MGAFKDKTPSERKDIMDNFNFLYGNQLENKNFVNEMLKTEEEQFENDFLDRIFNFVIKLSDKYFFAGMGGTKIKNSGIEKTKEFEIIQILLDKINLDKGFINNLFIKIYKFGISHYNKKKNMRKVMDDKYIIVEEIMEKIDVYLLDSIDICYH